jgi:hypothetical protein
LALLSAAPEPAPVPRVPGLTRTAFFPERLDPATLERPPGPFLLVAAWSSSHARQDAHGMWVVDGYQVFWVWEPEGLRGRVHADTFEPKGAVHPWRSPVIYDEPAGSFRFEEAVQRITRHYAQQLATAA